VSPGREAEGRELLETERDRLLRRIEELDGEWRSGELDEHSYRLLREDYVSKAAAVLRSLERTEAARAAAEPPPGHAGAARGTDGGGGRQRDDATAGGHGGEGEDGVVEELPAGGLLGRAGLACGAVLLAVLALVGSAAVWAGAGGQGAAAGAPGGGAPPQVSLELYRARTLENQGKDVEALQLFQQVLQVEPRNAEALAYEGWLLRQAGISAGDSLLVQQGRSALEAAVAADPRYPDAHALLGYVLFEDAHRPAEAVEQFQMFLSDHPPGELLQLTRGVMAEAFAAADRSFPGGAASAPG
jgi:hypothetical protein